MVFSASDQRVLGSNDDKDLFIAVVIGDSMSYGLGIRNEEVFANILEKKLNQVRKTKVYNLSLSGDNFIENYTKYKKAEDVINPNLVIFTFVENDLIFNDTYHYDRRDLYQLLLAEDCSNEVMGFDWQELSFEVQVHKYYFPSFSSDFSNTCILKNGIKNINKNKTIFAGFGKTDQISHTPNDESNTFEKNGIYR